MGNSREILNQGARASGALLAYGGAGLYEASRNYQAYYAEQLAEIQAMPSPKSQKLSAHYPYAVLAREDILRILANASTQLVDQYLKQIGRVFCEALSEVNTPPEVMQYLISDAQVFAAFETLAMRSAVSWNQKLDFAQAHSYTQDVQAKHTLDASTYRVHKQLEYLNALTVEQFQAVVEHLVGYIGRLKYEAELDWQHIEGKQKLICFLLQPAIERGHLTWQVFQNIGAAFVCLDAYFESETFLRQQWDQPINRFDWVRHFLLSFDGEHLLEQEFLPKLLLHDKTQEAHKQRPLGQTERAKYTRRCLLQLQAHQFDILDSAIALTEQGLFSSFDTDVLLEKFTYERQLIESYLLGAKEKEHAWLADLPELYTLLFNELQALFLSSQHQLTPEGLKKRQQLERRYNTLWNQTVGGAVQLQKEHYPHKIPPKPASADPTQNQASSQQGHHPMNPGPRPGIALEPSQDLHPKYRDPGLDSELDFWK